MEGYVPNTEDYELEPYVKEFLEYAIKRGHWVRGYEWTNESELWIKLLGIHGLHRYFEKVYYSGEKEEVKFESNHSESLLTVTPEGLSFSKQHSIQSILFTVRPITLTSPPDLFTTDFIHLKSVLSTLEEDAIFVRLKRDPALLPSKLKKVIGFGRSNKHAFH